ncbi:cysteine synthase A [Diaporthe amygdali]|uniref:cysteine synthase A n=1 Tax=Phomopsis amygdali TaxID=1214568 RepID=UPI0022FEB4EB|nr:cysteine synthase A [Diaporthe amygdali]KAJ0120631.1 cysteine synthase A [Diaporthe amygdali]
MAARNTNNVYTGPDSLRDYYDPDQQPMLPMVELPQKLNPFYEDGVRIYAKMMSTLPANNVKALPALNMLQNSVKPETKTIIEYSSGSTVISMSLIARALYGITDTRAFLSNKTSWTKLQLMRFFGLNITLFGGPSQPEPTDPRGGINKAKQLSSESGEQVLNPNQYTNEMNWKSHFRWTGPQILAQIPEINVFCCGMGTSGTMTGIGTYLKQAKSSVFRVGVCTEAGDRVPGPRSYALMSPVEFPWRAAVDTIEEVGSYDSYRLSLEMSRQGLICGPSSGFNLQGLCNFLRKRKSEGSLEALRGDDGEIHCVFVACDLPYQYLDEYFNKLGDEVFHPLINENLLSVDSYRYDEAWEVDVQTFCDIVFSSSPVEITMKNFFAKPRNVILDLRTAKSFAEYHLSGSISRSLTSLEMFTPSPFSDPIVLERQWKELESVFDPTTIGLLKNMGIVWLTCYDGDTSRVATSILRAKGVTANNLRGGMLTLLSTAKGDNNDRSESVDSGVGLHHPTQEEDECRAQTLAESGIEPKGISVLQT